MEGSGGKAPAGHALTVAVMTFISRAGGLVREVVMAHLFGAGVLKSAFDVAYRIPNLFRRLFGEGALSNALIPVYLETMQRSGKEAADRLASAVAGIAMAILSAAVLLGIFLSHPVEAWLDGSEKASRIMPLMRIMLPYAPLICLAALAMGVLNSLKSFAVSALAPAFQNLCTILAMVLVCPFFRNDAPAMMNVVAWSVLVSGAIQVLVQIPELKRCGVPVTLRISASAAEGVKRVFRLMLPMALSAGVIQVNVCLDSVLAMKAGAWGPSVLGYADRIVYLPLALVGGAFATVLLPALAEFDAARRHADFRETLSKSLAHVSMVMLPAAFGLIALSEEIVSVIYESGKFDALSVKRTSAALVAYSAGLLPAGYHKIMVAPFHAMKDCRTPVAVAVAGVVLNLAMNLFFIAVLPVETKPIGIAIATSISSLVATVSLMALLRRKGGRAAEPLISFASFMPAVATSLLASVAMALMLRPLYGCAEALAGMILGGKLMKAASLALCLPVAAGFYWLMERIMAPKHLKELEKELLSGRRRKGR